MLYHKSEVTIKQLDDQYKADPLAIRKLAVQEVVDRISKYKGTYLKRLIELNNEYGIDPNVWSENRSNIATRGFPTNKDAKMVAF